MKNPFNVHRRITSFNSVAAASILVWACGCSTPFTTAPKSTATLIQEASKKLASDLANNLPTNQRWRIAIKPLEILSPGGETGAISQALQESLKNSLFLTKRFDVTVVGTEMRQKVEDELRMQERDERVVKETWSLSPERKERLSTLLGADAIMIGTITAIDSDYLVNCQLIPLKDNLLGSVGEAKIRKTVVYSESNREAQPWNGRQGGGEGGFGIGPDGSVEYRGFPAPPPAGSYHIIVPGEVSSGGIRYRGGTTGGYRGGTR